MKVVLGSEHDVNLRALLEDVLKARHARRIARWLGPVGSRYLERSWYVEGWQLVVVLRQSGVGLIVRGSSAQVSPIHAAMRTRRSDLSTT